MIEYSNEGQSTPRSLFWLFLRLGALSFGGPLAHIALMQREFVEKRGWFSQAEFVDMIGATNLVPGPNSTELAMHIGHRRGGWKGLVASGVAFILPAAVLMTVLAAFYVRVGNQPQLQSPLRGLSAVVVAIIAHALWKFGRTALKNPFTIVAALVATLAVARGTDALSVLFVAALCGVLFGAWKHRNDKVGNKPDANETPASARHLSEESSTRNPNETSTKSSLPIVFSIGGASGIFAVGATPTLAGIFLLFLKIGAVLYGSGYVLIAFLRQDFVGRTQWISNQQLLDAVAFGQFTPGPLFTTATFIGYLLGDKFSLSRFGLGGIVGATVATIGIFLPSFGFVGFLSLLLKRWKDAPILRTFLDVVNAVSLALMAVVTWQLATVQLGRGMWQDIIVAALFVVSLALLFATKINSAWLLIGGAVCGFVLLL
ncbi:MAG TPA: chromate efflux transporter [Abditibacteriaceae bacterium]|nr:chromate efflux transporter [Abditibacteriaceae bacterium]